MEITKDEIIGMLGLSIPYDIREHSEREAALEDAAVRIMNRLKQYKEDEG